MRKDKPTRRTRASRRAGPAGARVRRIADRLHSASIRLLRRVRSADRASGLTPQRLSALSVVVFAGPVTLGDLAGAEQVSAPTITRLVQGLEDLGLVRRKRDPEDGRSYLLEATADGRRVLEEGRRRRIDALVNAISHLARRDLEILEQAAELMIDAADRPPSGVQARPGGRRAGETGSRPSG